MILKNFLVATISLFAFAFSNAGIIAGRNIKTLPSLSDSTGTDDSVKLTTQVNGTKQEFRDILNKTSLYADINKQKLNPRLLSFVDDYSNIYSKKLVGMKERCRPYLDLIDGILEEHGLPKELKYLAVIESDLKANARSAAGALGPWQFMPETARNMGLKITKNYDDRKDFKKSTRAACKYLSGLYSLYQDWLLVIAAYNSGPGKVNMAIKKSGSKDFWVLEKYLPAESQDHVKRFLATRYIMENQEGCINEMKDLEEASPLTVEEIAASVIQPISGRYNSSVIMKYIPIEAALFNRMNPDFDRLIGSDGTYKLRLPSDKMEEFIAQKPRILNESMQLLLSQANSGK